MAEKDKPDTETVSADSEKQLAQDKPGEPEETSSTPKEDSKRRRRRSNRPYPPASFEEAVKFAREVYEFNSGLPVKKLSFFDHIGRSPDSSASRDAITNANKYGLLKASFAAEQLELTQDGLSVVADEVAPREQARAKVRLGVENIDPFRQLYEKLAGNRLPARSALIDGMKDAGVPEDLTEEAVDLFIVNLRFVGLLQVLAGAERIISIDLLLDKLPSSNVSDRARDWAPPRQPGPQPQAVATSEQISSLETTCFYISPIGAEGSEPRRHSDLFLGSIVEPAMASLGLSVVRADTIGQPGIITRQILELILRSRLVVADLSFHNPNVFYELALRHAVRLPVVQIIRKADSIPFDINQMRTIQIDNTDLYSFVPNIEVYKSEVASQGRRALEAGYEVDTPVSVYFPTLNVTFGDNARQRK